MRRLSPDQFARARHFLAAQARPLDSALFGHRFETMPAVRVTEELAHYQNSDGGFGHALEPDVRTPSSSALATGIGLQILREVGCSGQHPAVRRGVEYLLRSWNPQTYVWRVVPQDANEHAHAPWWHDEDGSLRQTFDDFLIIPRAQIVGLLHHYAELVPRSWLETVTENTVVAVETLEEEAFGGGGDTLRYALDLAETQALPQRLKDRLLPRLRDLTDRLVCRDQADWGGYCTTPLKVAPSPDSAMADHLRNDLDQQLDYVIDHQAADGSWEPTWSWGDCYPKAWKQARREWRGKITLETLTSLQAFGRIEK